MRQQNREVYQAPKWAPFGFHLRNIHLAFHLSSHALILWAGMHWLDVKKKERKRKLLLEINFKGELRGTVKVIRFSPWSLIKFSTGFLALSFRFPRKERDQRSKIQTYTFIEYNAVQILPWYILTWPLGFSKLGEEHWPVRRNIREISVKNPKGAGQAFSSNARWWGEKISKGHSLTHLRSL